MNKKPLVSVIIPLYNAEDFIEKTINSVLKQTYENYEIIVVDDCSTDTSVQIVEAMQKDKRIQLIRSPKNFGGPAKPRNIGIRHAKGKYIAFLDADDIWLPTKLAKQVEYLEENESVAVCHTLSNVIDSHGKHIGKNRGLGVSNRLKYFMKTENILFYSNYININSVVMCNADGLQFNEDKNLIAIEDWRFWIDIQTNMKIELLEEVLVDYRVHAASISNRSSDIGYRKALHMFSKLLLEGDIPLRHYAMTTLFHLIKIALRNRR